jgi:voltage-gated potassium channel
MSKIRLYIILLFSILFLGSLSFSLIEGVSLVDAFYFILVTVSTVGFGDISPKTELGKILVLVIIVGGVGTFVRVLAGFSEMVFNRKNELRRQQKQRLVIGTFFTEFGNKLLYALSEYIMDLNKIRSTLIFNHDWNATNYVQVKDFIQKYPFETDLEIMDCDSLSRLMFFNKDVVINMLHNQVFLQQDGFTDLLQNLFHLYELLVNHDDITNVSDFEKQEIGDTLSLSFKSLLVEWLAYTEYLQKSNVQLFEYLLRRNPLYPPSALICLIPTKSGGYNPITLMDRFPKKTNDKIVVAIGNKRYSAELFRLSDQFTAVAPSQDMRKATLDFGTHSGQFHSKLRESKLRIEPAVTIDGIILPDAYENFECEIINRYEDYDHLVITAKILHRTQNPEVKKLELKQI